jgi:biotin-(acetyl-CoA carboxylase) ligase
MAKIGINISLHACPSTAKALKDFLAGGVREQDVVSATHQQQGAVSG